VTTWPECRSRYSSRSNSRWVSVVVGAHLQAGHPVGLLVASGQHDHRHLAGDPAADLEAVDAGQADVEHDELDRVAAQLHQRLLPGADPQHAVPIALQVRAYERADVRLVLDDHDGDAHEDIVGAQQAPANGFYTQLTFG